MDKCGHQLEGHAGPAPGPPRASFVSPRSLAVALRAGDEIPDDDFDRLTMGAARLPDASAASTPIAAARRALALLAAGEGIRVLDAGAGIGKLCIIGALTTRAVFTGVEDRLPFVRAARAAALRFGARRTTFIHGNVAHMALEAFDAIYLFDPVFELDGSCSCLTWRKMREARSGTRVVTYRGPVEPPGCKLLRREATATGDLALFEKQ